MTCEKTVTPAVPEPVAWQRRLKFPSGPGASASWETCTGGEAKDPFERRAGYEYRPLFSEAQMQALADRLETCKRGNSKTLTGMNAEINRLSAALAEARKVIEPFAAFARKAERFVEGRANNGGSPKLSTKEFRVRDFQAAADWLSANPTKETKPARSALEGA